MQIRPAASISMPQTSHATQVVRCPITVGFQQRRRKGSQKSTLPTTDELLDRCYKDIVARAKRGAVKCRLFLPKQMVSEAKWKAVKKSLSDNGYDLEPVARPPKDKWGLRVSWS